MSRREFKVCIETGDWLFWRDRPPTTAEVRGFLLTQIGMSTAHVFEKIGQEWEPLMQIESDDKQLRVCQCGHGEWHHLRTHTGEPKARHDCNKCACENFRKSTRRIPLMADHQFNLRVDSDLWQRVKVKALAERLTLKALVAKLLTDWLDR